MKNIIWVLELIKELSRSGYTGKVEINFQFGGISNVNKFESLKAPQEALAK